MSKEQLPLAKQIAEQTPVLEHPHNGPRGRLPSQLTFTDTVEVPITNDDLPVIVGQMQHDRNRY